MVLYHVSTTYQLLYSIAHKLTYHKNEESELLMIEYIRPRNELGEFRAKLLEYGYFTRVRCVPERLIKLQKGIALDEKSSEKDINTVIDNSCRAFIGWYREDLKEYDRIYVASDQHAFGVYLVRNRIPYIYMEDASGMLSEHERYIFITKRNNLTDYIISQYLGGAGENEMITAKLCDLDNQLDGFSDPLAVDFSIYKALKTMIPDKVPSILSFFGDMNEAVSSEKKICLFLTQDLNTLKIKDIDRQEMTMTMVADYMCPEHRLVIKPHPKDRWQNYSRIFPDAKLLSRKMPSELLPFAIDGDVDTALTVSSTSIRGMVNAAKHSYYFTTEAETYPEALNPMYAAAELLTELGINGGVSIQNINETQMKNFLESRGISLGEGSAVIDGGVERVKSISCNARLELILNLGSVLSFSADWDFDNICLIRARYSPLEGSLMPRCEYLIYAVCTDEETKRRLKGIDLERKLKYSKAEVKITAEKIDGRTIKMLAARQKRDMEWG